MNRTYHPRGVTVDGYAVREHPNYYVWANMLSRCENPNDANHKNYGGRGIRVCRRWYHFQNFVTDMGMRPDDVLTIERRDNNRGYEPDNCQWETRSNQCVNRRRFRSNTSGVTGVIAMDNGTFQARFDYEHERYQMGSFPTLERATEVRRAFVELFFADREKAIQMLQDRPAETNSKTGVRGVTLHVDGGYLVRHTVNGVRHYIGYFKTFEAAVDAKSRFLAR